MATAIHVLGWENGLLEADAVDSGDDFPVVSATRATFGAHSLRHDENGANTTVGMGRVVDSLTEIQVGFSFNHDGTVSIGAGGTRRSNLIHFICEDGRDFRVSVGHDGNLTLRDDSTVLDTLAFSGSGLSTTNTWFSVSCAIKIDASTGYFVFYGASGEELLSFSGNTGSSPIVAVLIGGWDISAGTGGGLNDFSYFTDVIIYDNAGGGAAPAPARRLLWSQASGNGQSSEWTGSDGNSTDNYLLVDDGVTPDEDSTYVKALTPGLQDQYTHGGITIPADWVAREVWPTVIAKKTDSTQIQLLLGLHKSLISDSEALDLSTSYGMVQARFTTLPDASDLEEANIDAAEIRVVSAGSFS